MSGSFVLYQRYQRQFELLTMEQRGQLITAIFMYAEGQEVPEIADVAVKMAFSFIAEQLDYDKGEYEKKCRKNSENISKRWCKSEKKDTTVCDSIPNDTTAYLSDSESESVSESVSDSDNERESKKTRTRAPTHKKTKKSGSDYSFYGRYENVRLTKADMAELKDEFPDIAARVERLSEYIATHGDKYKNHAAVIRSWASNGRDEAKKAPYSAASGSNLPRGGNLDGNFSGKTGVGGTARAAPADDDEGNEYFEAALARARKFLGESGTSPPLA